MPKVKKLLLSIPALRGGGAERVMTTLANAWADKGYEVHLVTYEAPGTTPYYDLDPQVKLAQLNCLAPCKWAKPSDLAQRFFKLRRCIKTLQPDIIISFLDTNNIMAVLASLGLKTPVIISERVNPKVTPIGSMKKQLRDWAYEKADLLVVQNIGIQQCFSPIVQQHTTLIPNPIRSMPNVKWHGSQDEVIAVGRLDDQKGFSYLINAFANVVKNHPNWTLRIIGEGGARPKLEQQIQDLGLQNSVTLPGHSTNVIKDISSSKIFVMSSLYEGMPNALMEAMAIGMPVISTDCNFGPRDLVDPNKNGILIPTHDSSALAEAIEMLIKNKSLREKYGAAARKSMQAYDLESVLKMWDHAFKKVTNPSDTRP